MNETRNSAKALIIRGGKVLLTANKDSSGIYYLLPGGGQKPGETLTDTLKRECREEVSADVEVGPLKFVREYIGRNHEFAGCDRDMHQVEFMFMCLIRGDGGIKNGPVPDGPQTGVEWVEFDRLETVRIYPSILKRLIPEAGGDRQPAYLGDVN
ncbi:MAG: NUDIX domain-containing protein [bacterium]